MSSHVRDLWLGLQSDVAALEKEGVVRGTFRRLSLEKQQQIVMAVLAALAERPAGLNIKHIAADAGVSVGSMYQYFPNRDRMVEFVVALTARYVTASFKGFEPYLASLPLREGLSMYLLGGIDWSQEQSAFLRLFARCAYCGDDTFRETLVTPISDAMRGMVLRMLASAAARGEISSKADLDSAARFINGFMIVVGDALLLPHLNYYFQIFKPETDPMPQMSAAVEFVVRALGASTCDDKKEEKS